MYTQQLNDLAAKHNLTVHYSTDLTCVNVQNADGSSFLCTPCTDSRDDNVLACLAFAMDLARDWPVVMLPSHSKHPRSRDLRTALPMYTGMVRVYREGVPPATWLCKQGALCWQF